MVEYLDPGDKDLGENTPKAPFFSNAPASSDTRLAEGEKGKGIERDDPGESETWAAGKIQESQADFPSVSLLVLSELEAHSLVHL